MSLFGLDARTASAVLIRVQDGKAISYMPTLGARAQRSPQIFDHVFGNLDYSGGPVMPSNENYTIVWNPSNYSGSPFQPGYVSGVSRFFMDLQHDSALHRNTNSDSVSTQYSDASRNVAAYDSTYGASIDVSDALPRNGCPALTGDICLTDAQLQGEIDRVLTSNRLPRDLTHEYFLLTPPDVASCFNTSGSRICSANADVNQGFCAFHAASSTPDSFLYANIPDLAGDSSCDPFMGNAPCDVTACDYPNGPADGVLSAVSHEHNESLTDPEPGATWTDWQPGCTPSSPIMCGGEIGDKCNDGPSQADPNTVANPQPDGHDAPFNETVNGHVYWIQGEWSNQGKACLDSFTPNGSTASAEFSQSDVLGNTLIFDASTSSATGGVAEYVWQFNDGPDRQSPQEDTVETTSPVVAHTFSSPGVYDVALTVMAADGTSIGTVRGVLAASAPIAAFGFSPSSPLYGEAVSFDGTASRDPNPRGSISSYSWSFGDGEIGAGARTSHVYTIPGRYTVTLTVTNGFGKSSISSHTITVVIDELPAASFTTRAAGRRVLFRASASDPDGSITSYSWIFGDGRFAVGPRIWHRYPAPGRYAATVAVTDSGGQSASVSHTIVIGAVRCVVPRVTGETKQAARGAIRARHCKVGRLRVPKRPSGSPGSGKDWTLVVRRQSPRPGRVVPPGTKISLRFVYKALPTRTK